MLSICIHTFTPTTWFMGTSTGLVLLYSYAHLFIKGIDTLTSMYLFSFEGQLCTFSWVLSLLDRYFYTMYIVIMLRTILCLCLHFIDFPITYRNSSVLYQSEYACLHLTVNMVVLLVKSNENTCPKGRALL